MFNAWIRQKRQDLAPLLKAARLSLAQLEQKNLDGVLWLALLIVIVGLAQSSPTQGGYQFGFLALNQALQVLPAWFWQWVTRLGDTTVLVALGLFIAIRRPEIYWSLLLAALFATLYSRGLKPLLDTPRPPAELAPDLFTLIGPAHSRAGWPSGHTVSSFVFAGVLLVFIRQIHWKLMVLLIAVVAGLSRVALGVHWLHDVLGGALGGLVSAWCGVYLAQRWPAGLQPKIFIWLCSLPPIAAVALFFIDSGYPASSFWVWPLSVLVLAAWWRYLGPQLGRKA